MPEGQTEATTTLGGDQTQGATGDSTTGSEGDTGSGQPNNEEFQNSLPEEYRGDPTFSSYNSFGDLLKSHKSSQAMVGKDKLAFPGTNGTDEQWRDFHTKLGCPESSDKYSFGEVDKNSYFKPEPDMVKSFKESLHKVGVSDKQANAIFTDFVADQNRQLVEVKKSTTDAESRQLADLHAKWGMATKDNENLAKAALDYAVKGTGLDAEKMAEFMDVTRFGNNPELLQMFSFFGRLFVSDDPTGTFGARDQDFDMSPSQASAEMAKLRRDPEFMEQRRNARDPEHDKANARWAELSAMKNFKPQQEA